jgi:hypothetical protein
MFLQDQMGHHAAVACSGRGVLQWTAHASLGVGACFGGSANCLSCLHTAMIHMHLLNLGKDAARYLLAVTSVSAQSALQVNTPTAV